MDKSIEDARVGGPSGCVTIGAFGKESVILTGYMNWPKILELALNNGVDPASGERVGVDTGDPREFQSFNDVFEAYKKRRADYLGPYAEYKKNDPYHMSVFEHSRMKVEFWKDLERDLWID